MKKMLMMMVALLMAFGGLMVAAEEMMTPEALEGYYSTVESSTLKGIIIEPQSFTLLVEDLEALDEKEDPLRFELSKWKTRVEELSEMEMTQSVAEEEVEEDTTYFKYEMIDEANPLAELAPYKITIYNPEYKEVTGKFIVKMEKDLIFRFSLDDHQLTDDWDNVFMFDESVDVTGETEDSME